MSFVSKEISFPFRFDATGKVATQEDLGSNIAHHIAAVLLTRFGERVMLPPFGSAVPDYVFENIDEIGAVELTARANESLRRWVPEAYVESVLPRYQDPVSGVMELEVIFRIPPREDVLTTILQVGGAIVSELT